MILGHFSDLHGDLSCLNRNLFKPDLWVCTGDFFPNRPSKINRVFDWEAETQYQQEWFHYFKNELIRSLHGIPLLWLAGNHDWTNLAELLSAEGYPAISVTEDAPYTYQGIKFSGFLGIPFIEGYWMYESTPTELFARVDKVLGQDASVLLTHAPPGSILTEFPGIDSLTSQLVYRVGLSVKAHLFGHCHKNGGCFGYINDTGGVLCVNSATTLQFVEVTQDSARVVFPEKGP